ncbi:MAG: S24 family peptidase [Tannerellaceae bacterium]|nr:S24 family peptidase [Tannerellaceae bacterium]
MNIKDRIQLYLDYKGINTNEFERSIGASKSYWRNTRNISAEVLGEIVRIYSDLNLEWVLSEKGSMVKQAPDTSLRKTIRETRPRIPMNAAAGSVSEALQGVKVEECEQMPVVEAFSKYNYTLFVKGDSMEPEFHSGDELACLQMANPSFIQWGRYHVLDTSQGVLVKRIYDDGECILCKSEASELYQDFRIPKSDIYNIALVIGMLRRY